MCWYRPEMAIKKMLSGYAMFVVCSDAKREIFNQIDFIDKQLECRKTQLLYYSPNITLSIIGEEIKNGS